MARGAPKRIRGRARRTNLNPRAGELKPALVRSGRVSLEILHDKLLEVYTYLLHAVKCLKDAHKYTYYFIVTLSTK